MVARAIVENPRIVFLPIIDHQIDDMTQQIFRFLSLPRELRDKIYRYAVIEPDGYHHDPTSGRLKTIRSTSPQLALIKTCKQVAEEMNGLALQENIIIFKSYSDPSVSSYAEEFDRLRRDRNSSFRTMLRWASECITMEKLFYLRDRYPFHEPIRRLCEMDRSRRIEVLKASSIPYPARMWEHFTDRAVEELVIMISTDERFFNLTAKDYDEELRGAQRLFSHVDWDDDDDTHVVSYGPNSQMRLIELKLQPWDIPEPDMLEEMDKLMPRIVWDSEDDSHSESANLTHRSKFQTSSYFSGTSYTIQFLRSIKPETFRQLRRVVIEENHDSVGRVESHAYGLISFCQENQNLKFDIQINIWHSIIKHAWTWGLESLSLNDIVSNLSDWLRAISRLRGEGMPEGQCNFVFGGTEPSLLQRIWNDAKTVAALQEAILETPEEGPLPNHHFLLFGIAEDFHLLMEQAIKRDLPISFGPDLGDMWDPEQACYDLEHTFPHTYEWKGIIDLSYFELEKDVWDEVKSQYWGW